MKVQNYKLQVSFVYWAKNYLSCELHKTAEEVQIMVHGVIGLFALIVNTDFTVTTEWHWICWIENKDVT